MKRAIIAVLACCSIAGVAIGATPPPKKAATPQKKTTAATPSKSMPQKKPATVVSRQPARTGTTTRAPQRRYYSRQAVRRAPTPQQPTSDRYKQIQDALAAKGYLTTPSNGVWDQQSVQAMQRFQQDQKLEPTGKLTARSLVALGLGPKDPAVTAVPAGGESSGGGSAEVAPAQ
jgi:hypothetical protein